MSTLVSQQNRGKLVSQIALISQRELAYNVGRVTIAKASTLIGNQVMPILFDIGVSLSVLWLDAWQDVVRRNPYILWQLLQLGMSLHMPNSTSLPMIGQVTLLVTVLGHTHPIEAYIVYMLLTDLIISLPAMSQMGAVIDTSDLAIRLKTNLHHSLKIQLESGAPREVYTVLKNIQLPAHTELLVEVEGKALGLSKPLADDVWREVTPYRSSERYKKILVAPGVTNKQVRSLLVANLADKPVSLYKGTRLAMA